MPAGAAIERLRRLQRIVRRECAHLRETDRRLFTEPFTIDTAKRLDADIGLAEQVEAFVARFGRLQDTLADKFIPACWRRWANDPGRRSTTSTAPNVWAGSVRPTIGWACASCATR